MASSPPPRAVKPAAGRRPGAGLGGVRLYAFALFFRDRFFAFDAALSLASFSR
jgi:hypothetical protein